MAQAHLVDALAIIGDETQDDWLDDSSLSVGPGTDVTLLARSLRQAGADPALYTGAWLLLPSREHPHRERALESYDPATGQVGWASDPLSSAVNATERFMIFTRWRPRDVERALLRVLRETMYHVAVYTLTGAAIDGLRQINLSTTQPALLSANQVMAVTKLDGTVPSAEEGPISQDFAYTDAGVDTESRVQLSLQSLETFKATDVLRLYAWVNWADDSPIDPLALSTGTTGARDNWWAAEAMWSLSRKSQYRDTELEARMVDTLNRLRPLFQPERSYRAFEPRPQWGPIGVAGW